MEKFSSDNSKKVKPAMCLLILDLSHWVNRRLTLNPQSEFSFNSSNWGAGREGVEEERGYGDEE